MIISKLILLLKLEANRCCIIKKRLYIRNLERINVNSGWNDCNTWLFWKSKEHLLLHVYPRYGQAVRRQHNLPQTSEATLDRKLLVASGVRLATFGKTSKQPMKPQIKNLINSNTELLRVAPHYLPITRSFVKFEIATEKRWWQSHRSILSKGSTWTDGSSTVKPRFTQTCIVRTLDLSRPFHLWNVNRCPRVVSRSFFRSDYYLPIEFSHWLSKATHQFLKHSSAAAKVHR